MVPRSLTLASLSAVPLMSLMPYLPAHQTHALPPLLQTASHTKPSSSDVRDASGCMTRRAGLRVHAMSSSPPAFLSLQPSLHVRCCRAGSHFLRCCLFLTTRPVCRLWPLPPRVLLPSRGSGVGSYSWGFTPVVPKPTGG